LGLVLVGLAFLARLSLDPVLGVDAFAYSTFYIAVAVAEFVLGFGPALMVLGVGLIASLWFIVPPRDSLALRGVSDGVEIVLYSFVAGTIVCLMEWLQKARQQAANNAHLAEARRHEIEAARDHLEELVAERTRRLSKTVEELEHFSYAITHDMRAPLRAMGSYAGLIREECPELTAEGHEYCHRIMAAAERLDLLICDSLNYTKVMLEEMPLQPIELSGFLQDLIDTYPNLQHHCGSIRVSPGLPRVLANQASLAQCFANLLGNAVKFASVDRPLQIRIWGESRQEFVRICVEDNGVGIPKHAQQRLFGMFQRLNSAYEGTGMGLAIVRKVVERMGGAVGATSEPGKGSCFWVELRRATGAGTTVHSPSQGTPAKGDIRERAALALPAAGVLR
jgi:signal transduction histidine kinase